VKKCPLVTGDKEFKSLEGEIKVGRCRRVKSDGKLGLDRRGWRELIQKGKYPFTPSSITDKIAAWGGRNGLSLCWSWC
jgi:hypothetical protein